MVLSGHKPRRHVRFIVRHRLTDAVIQAEIPENGTPVVTAVVLKSPGKHAEAGENSGVLSAYSGMISGFLDGRNINLARIPVDLSRSSGFARKVLRAARRIPRGATVSYARLAAMAGHPKAFRAAASVMRNNPLPLIIPCHRVVGSDGSLGGFMGKKAGKAVALKKMLLEHESGCLEKHAEFII